MKERLRQDLQQALRDRDAQRKSAIRLVWTAITNEEIAAQRELNDEAVLDIIRREVKQHRESLSEFKKAGRADLIAQEQEQLHTLLHYLPPQMSREELWEAAREAVTEAGAATPEDLGRVMSLLMPRVKGSADGRVVKQIVKELLSADE